MQRHFYSSKISNFIKSSENEILGTLAQHNEFSLEQTQRESWIQEIKILKEVLKNYEGSIFFEYSIPRMGRRIDVVLLIKNVIFILEFKVGEKEFLQSAIDQVSDYALDLKNFHKTSHKPLIAPILIATRAKAGFPSISKTPHNDNVLDPIRTNTELLLGVINAVLQFADGDNINVENWAEGSYSPTPTIIEAAMALYNGHSVSEISRSDATAKNLKETTNAISKIILEAKETLMKSLHLQA